MSSRRGRKRKSIDAVFLMEGNVRRQEDKRAELSVKFPKVVEDLVASAPSTPGVSASELFACLILECKSLTEATCIAEVLECIVHLHVDIQRQIVGKSGFKISNSIFAKSSSAFAHLGISNPKRPRVLCSPVGKCLVCSRLLSLRSCGEVTLWSSEGSTCPKKAILKCKECKLSYGPTRYTSASMERHYYYGYDTAIIEGNRTNYFTAELMSLFANLQ